MLIIFPRSKGQVVFTDSDLVIMVPGSCDVSAGQRSSLWSDLSSGPSSTVLSNFGRPTLYHETEILKHEIREHEIRELVSHGATLVQNFRGGVGLMVAVDILGGICCHLGFP